jgi:hypothetical protein
MGAVRPTLGSRNLVLVSRPTSSSQTRRPCPTREAKLASSRASGDFWSSLGVTDVMIMQCRREVVRNFCRTCRPLGSPSTAVYAIRLL